MTEKDIVDFFFEAGQLKRVKRSGCWIAKIKDPDTVAEHSFRAAVIGYVLAKLEKADPYKVVMMCLLQDLPEARLNDIHKIGQRYLEVKGAEKQAFEEQMQRLPKEMAAESIELFKQYGIDSTKEGIIARDADLLEDVVQHKEYLDIGYKDSLDWIHNAGSLLKTESAKKLLRIIEGTDSSSWWHDLKNITR
ncbi:MAG: HD domain-containing protein [Candidatus Woesearchaeota archaeon]